jgi:pimeloyl-ACP methyl ester carboxylesterase
MSRMQCELIFFAAMVGVLLYGGTALATTVLSKADVAPYLHAQRLVDIGGRRLNLYCIGRGSPAVILDAGAGDTAFTWRKVQPAIARFTRVCSYDRAGLGFSDGGPVPRDANAAVHDLHTLLQRAGISPPYVLVGHSEAGFYEPLYADRYPAQVAGMVLVDPSFPNDEQLYDAVSPTAARMDASVAGIYHRCYEAALQGTLAQGSAAYAVCGFPLHWQAASKARCAVNGPAFCELLHVQIGELLRPAYWLDSGSETIEAMPGVSQANYATYNVHVHITGLGFLLTRETDGECFDRTYAARRQIRYNIFGDVPQERRSDVGLDAAGMGCHPFSNFRSDVERHRGLDQV